MKSAKNAISCQKISILVPILRGNIANGTQLPDNVNKWFSGDTIAALLRRTIAKLASLHHKKNYVVTSQKRALNCTTYTFTLHDGRFWNHESVLEAQLAEKGYCTLYILVCVFMKSRKFFFWCRDACLAMIQQSKAFKHQIMTIFTLFKVFLYLFYKSLEQYKTKWQLFSRLLVIFSAPNFGSKSHGSFSSIFVSLQDSK